MKEYFNSKAKLIILKSYKALNEESNALHESLEAGKDTYINLPCIKLPLKSKHVYVFLILAYR